MGNHWHEFPMRDTVAPELVDHQTKRFPPLALQEPPEESPRRTRVPTGLREDVDDIAILVNGSPQVLSLTIDRDEHLVEIPGVAETTLTTFQSTCVLGSELDRPLSDRFIRHVHAALRE